MFLRRSLAQYKYIYYFVGTFGGLAPPPPPQYQKAGYATGGRGIHGTANTCSDRAMSSYI